MADDDLGFMPTQSAAAPQEDLGFIPVEPDTSAMKAYVRENIAKAQAEKAEKVRREPVDTSVKPIPAETFGEALAAGWGLSVTGLVTEGEAPALAVAQDSGRIVKIASMVAQVAGDVPAMIAGGVLGGVAGASVGAAAAGAAGSVVPVAGTLVGLAAGAVGGSVVGAQAGANALPEGLRKIMMDHYERGDITTAQEFFDRLSGASWAALKGGTIGALTFGAGRAVAPAVTRAGGGMALQTATKTAAELGTMVSVSSALEGQLPNADDFINGAILLGGLGGSLKVAGKIRKNFVETGELPAQTVERISDDVILKQEVVAVNDRSVKPPSIDPPADLMETPPSQLSQKWSELYRKTSEGYQRGLDDMTSFKLAKEALAEGKEIPAGSDPYLLARNYRGVDTKSWSFENNRTFDFKTGKANGESLAQIYKDMPDMRDLPISESESAIISRLSPEDVKGKDNQWKKLNAYRVAKRAVELQKRGVETGIDIEAAKKVVNENSGAIEPIVKRVQAYEDRALQYYADSGGVSKKELELIRKMNREYVPFHRLMEPDPFDVKGKKGNSLKQIKGSENMILDPERVSRENVRALIKIAEKNRIYNRLAELQENAPESAPQIMRKKEVDQRPISVQKEEVGRFLKEHGFDESQIPDEGLVIFRPNQQGLAKNEFQFKREGSGKREVWQILPEYQDALEALNYEPAESNLLLKMLSFPAKTLRTGTALSPDFVLRNIWRDQFGATVQSKYGHIPFVDAIKSIGMMWKKDDAWISFLESGAFSGGLANLKGFLDGDLHSLNKETGFIDKAWNVVKHPIHAAEILSTMAENVPRFTEFRKSGAVGGSFDDMVRGAIGAREVTVDFQRAGAGMRMYSPFVAFANVGMQGTDRFFRAFKEDPKRTTALAMATITIPSIATWMNGRDDSRYKDAPDWQKNLFWVWPTDSWEQATSPEDYNSRPADLRRIGKNGELMVNNGVVLRLPKPFEMGVLFGSLPERALERFYDQDKSAFKEFDNTILQAVIPNLFPTAAVGITEHLSNHSFFLDSDIVSPHAEQMLPEERYSSYTSETAKQIAKIIGYVPYVRDIGSKSTPLNAPAVIDNYLSVWGGTGGKYVVQLSDSLLKSFGLSEKAEKPAWTWGDAPFAKAFVMKYPSAKTEPIRSFYERYNKATQVYGSMKKAMAEGNEDRFASLSADYEGKMPRLQGVYKALGDMNKVLNNLQNSDVGLDGEKRDPSQRTQLMTTTYFQMNEIAKAANEIMDEIGTQK